MQRTFTSFVSRNKRFIPLLATALLAFAAYGLGAYFMEGMRNPQVFFNIFRNSPFLLISATGMTLVILTGGIDLSVSGVVALTTVAAAALLREGMNTWLVIGLMLLMGMALGATMGSFIAYLKVQPFIATLAGMWFARGMCFFISDDAISISDRTYMILAKTKILIPGLTELAAARGQPAPYVSISVVVAALVFITFIYIAQYTRFGRTVYAIGGNEGRNEQSARLMGLPVETTKVMVYTLNGFCSALAGITFSIFVASGHGLYANGFEMEVIASVVMGGTMLSGGSGYVFGTLFGTLILGITQTLIQFNGNLSSWWTRIVIGVLTLLFIGVQSLLAAPKSAAEAARPGLFRTSALRRRRTLVLGGSGVLAIAILSFFVVPRFLPGNFGAQTPEARRCELKPYRQEEAASLVDDGAVLVYERNGGSRCVDELYAIYPDGRIAGTEGERSIEKQITTPEVDLLIATLDEMGWFTDDLYNTWHTPCGQCYGYYLTVKDGDRLKTVKGVDGGTDAPAVFWHVISQVKGIIPQFPAH